MSLEDLGNIGEFVAAIAVVVSLIYLALQIRQNSSWLRASLEQSILDSTNQTLVSVASSPQFSRIVFEGQERFEELSEDEQRQFAIYCTGTFRVYEQAFHQFCKGNISNEIWSSHEALLRMALQSKAVRRWWRARREVYNETFRQYVDEIDLDHVPPSPDAVLAALRDEEVTD